MYLYDNVVIWRCTVHNVERKTSDNIGPDSFITDLLDKSTKYHVNMIKIEIDVSSKVVLHILIWVHAITIELQQSITKQQRRKQAKIKMPLIWSKSSKLR